MLSIVLMNQIAANLEKTATKYLNQNLFPLSSRSYGFFFSEFVEIGAT